MKGNAVCCVDADSDQGVWRVEGLYPLYGRPSVTEGRMLIGMGKLTVIACERVFACVSGQRQRRTPQAGPSRAQTTELSSPNSTQGLSRGLIWDKANQNANEIPTRT